MNIIKEKITPDMAAFLLQKNDHNRKINSDIVDFYAKQMSEKSWQTDTAETIKLAEDMTLIDGQHRLHAVIKSQSTIDMYVAYNVPHQAFTVVDTGKSRQVYDIITINHKGLVNATTAISAIRKYFQIQDKSIMNYKRRSNQVFLDFIKEHSDLLNFITNKVKSSYSYQKNGLINVPLFSAIMLHYFVKNDKYLYGKFVCFMEEIAGISQQTNKSVSTYRNYLIALKNKPKTYLNSESETVLFWIWNKYKTNKEAKIIRIDKETIQNRYDLL